MSTLTSRTTRTRSAPAPHRVLRLERQRLRFLLAQPASIPGAPKEVEAELATEGLLDHVTVAPAGAGRAHLDRTEHLVIDRERGSHLGIDASSHHRISRHASRRPGGG